MNAKFGKLRGTLLAVLMILLGVVLFVWSNGTMNAICRIVGIGFVVGAALLCFLAYRLREEKGQMILHAALAVVALIAGVIFLAKPEFVIALLPIFVGVAIAADGVISLMDALRLRKLGLPFILPLVLAIVAICFGILLFANPFSTMEMLVKVMGVILMYTGIANLISGFTAKG